MKAVVLRKPGVLEVAEVPRPRAGPGEVLVRVRACGICGSDLRYLRGENPWAQHTLGIDKKNPPDLVLGHEVAGEIVEAEPRTRIGERVVLLPFRACGRCHCCERGKQHLCPDTQHLGHGAGWEALGYNPGGMAEYCPIWAGMAKPLPESISFEEATLLDGAAVALHAVRRASLARGEGFAVLGCGPIGLLILQVAKARGGGPALAVDIDGQARKLAAELGADAVLDPRSEDLSRAALDASRGPGVGAVFNTVGSPESAAEGLRLLAAGGRELLLAVPMAEAGFPFHLLAGERSLAVSANYRYPELEEAIALLAEGRIRVEPMITHRFPLDRAAEAFRAAENKAESGAVKVVLYPSGPGCGQILERGG
jgi:2-desacetyl-2-hydroxyethyl bacteriochlorophyllide A dehydrogenase